MDHKALFPLFVPLTGRLCVVVGAGAVALRRCQSLLAHGAWIRVIAPQFVQGFDQLFIQDRIEREFTETDLVGAFMVIAATNDPQVNDLVMRLCAKQGILACRVDQSSEIHQANEVANHVFSFPAVLRSGPVSIGISTSATEPALAKHLREQIQKSLPQWLEEFRS